MADRAKSHPVLRAMGLVPDGPPWDARLQAVELEIARARPKESRTVNRES